MSHSTFRGLRRTVQKGSSVSTTSASSMKVVSESRDMSRIKRLYLTVRHRQGQQSSVGSETSSTPTISEECSLDEHQEDTCSPEILKKRLSDLLAQESELKRKIVRDKARVRELYEATLLTKEHHTEAQSLTEEIRCRKHNMSGLRMKARGLQDKLTEMGISWKSMDSEFLAGDLAGDEEALCQFCHEEEADTYFLCSHPKNACLECADAFLPYVARCPSCEQIWGGACSTLESNCVSRLSAVVPTLGQTTLPLSHAVDLPSPHPIRMEE
eukprot:GGOE01033386.1.p1 GENE.GGOE01033386.1~~GGOE01033386.1.p1  ORF type:complete len:280 (-),score=53.95 GGOE01033386.1:456-1265(-)